MDAQLVVKNTFLDLVLEEPSIGRQVRARSAPPRVAFADDSCLSDEVESGNSTSASKSPARRLSKKRRDRARCRTDVAGAGTSERVVAPDSQGRSTPARAAQKRPSKKQRERLKRVLAAQNEAPHSEDGDP
mmetsp:Transcript_102900/g.297540  ORF Transcript_102900/g.297540 Transcript_102900/m.297540 type:complete len:131 (-) Transcript_102900:169-561(-)|eukprot:CAMPEP_0176058966 /NCGR_PEP_ID=MMETSP0120_2-20121206/29383_1 /TAXON_ID=160619 /ORGANISM="Kryptoperidinium foliaceum, Strain CCMP 1326" /LENGTH=130 /DNA_ID=CAMNT_0017392499 /DNA_START=45 /DNA_END=437 /DNA_ORIENTATION=+